MQGPIQGGIGIIKGTGSLLAHTVGGVSGSVSKMTNTINRGFLVLSADPEYRQKKEITDIKEKPSGIIDGVGKGFKGFGKGLWAGVTGLVTQPYKGAKKQGFVGFGKGVGKAVVGVGVKPISGTIDLISKTTEGIESAVDGGICRANNQKMRLPRAFYKASGVFKEHSTVCNKAYELLRGSNRSHNKPYAS